MGVIIGQSCGNSFNIYITVDKEIFSGEKVEQKAPS
jgi:hypothetical protein